MLYIYINIATNSLNHNIVLKQLDVLYFPKFLLYNVIYGHKHEKP